MAVNKKAALLPIALLSSIAYSQTNQEHTPAKASRMLEEVVVTAQKREERMTDVPISIAAFSEATLEMRGVTNAGDLEAITPSMVYDNLVGYSLIYMRGVGTEVFTPNSEPSVATYVDGVYFPFAHGLAQEFVPIERIEVLKGPQGTLFGRNASAGAINVISKQISDEWTTSLDAGVGSFNRKNAKAYVSGPIIDGIAFSLSGLYSFDEPYYDLAPTSPREKLDDNVSKGINGRLKLDISEELSVTVNAYQTGFEGTWTVPNSQTKPTTLGTANGSTQVRPGKRETNFNGPSSIEADTIVYATTIDYHHEKFDSKIIVSYQDVETDTRWDYDNGPSADVFFYPTNQFLKSKAAELQILSNDNTPFAEYLNWIAGAYYYASEGGFDPILIGYGSFDSAGQLNDSLSPLFSTLSSSTGLISPDAIAPITMRGVIDTESYAGFTQATGKLFDLANLTIGVRYQAEYRKLLKSSIGIATNTPEDPQETTLIDYIADNGDYAIKNTDISPRIALDVDIFDDTLLYASFSQAFKSGTINVVAISEEPSTVDPEKTSSFEIGVKGTALDGTLKYSAAIFRNEIEDLQVLTVSLASGGLVSLVNAAEAAIDGAEFDVTWQMLPNALPGFVLTASGGYMNSQYESFPDGTGFDETTGIGFGPTAASPARDFSGNETVRTPEYSGALGLSYTMQVPGGDLEVGASGYYNSGYYFDAQNDAEQPEYYTVDARISYFHPSSGVRVTAIGKNLNDRLYFTNIFPNDFGHAATFAPPTTYALLFSYDY
jgi:iron complex outermembrane receptor protein